ncbi:transporter substrate-binding domain-containing protein [Erwinia sp. P6884]|uniref:ATP-binding protein n=1 Tax=Erwinia sp. P6884 TaxID=3141450 RepID=UPI003192D887
MRVLNWLLLFFISGMTYGGATQEPLKLLARSQEVITDPGLSAGEWRWVREHRKIRLAVWLPMSPPYDITTGLNDYGGINADFIGLAADNLGVEIEVIRYENYDAALAALRAGKADFIAQASDNQRSQGLVLSEPYSANIAVEVVNNEASLDNAVRKIAIAPAYDPQKVQQRYPQAEIVSFYSARHALEALAFRKTDLFFCDDVTARYLVSQSNISNLLIRPLAAPFPVTGFSFAAMPQMQTWINVLNKVLKALPESTSVEIHRRWNGGIPLSLSEQQPVYTSLEHKWIREHKHIRVAVAEDNPPVAFFDEGHQLHGIIATILTALQLRTGFTFEIQRYPTQRAALDAVKSGQEDLVAGVTQKDIWRADLLTTRTWLYNSWVMVGRKDHVPDALNPTVISLDGQSPEEWLRKRSGRLPEKVDIWRHGLNRVIHGESKMLAMPLIVANTLLEDKQYASLHILGSIDIDPMRFSFGTSRQAWPLITILNKALINIPPEDLHAITRGENARNSFSSSTPTTFPLSLVLGVTAAVLLLLAAATYGYRRHQRQQQQMLALVETLKEARNRADSANRAKSAFLTTMSHEIRTPVSAIIGLLELVMKRPGDTPQNRQSVKVAWDAAQALLLLIGQILDVSRIESGRLVLRPERASLRKLIEESALLFEGMAAQKKVSFVLELDADLHDDVLVDRSRFRQILVNLVGNAIKFTGQGQVRLGVQLEERDGGYLLLRIEVEDTGEGIDEATRQRLFRPFIQGDNPEVSQGSGLGLYICQTLAKMMEGSIDLQSEPGNGTLVTVRLKLPVMPALPDAAATATATRSDSRSLSVLIVDDNPAGRMLLAQQLGWLGHRVISVESPKAALEKLAGIRPDVIITDCNIPGMSGVELTRIIHTHYPSVIVFGATADAREAVREAAREAGMRDCLFKPVTLNMLTDLLASITVTDTAPALPQWSPAKNLPPELLEVDNLSLFLSLQLSVLDESLTHIRAWHDAPDLSLRETLHKLRGGIQLLGVPALEAACEAQEAAPDSEGLQRLEAELELLRTTLQHWLDSVQLPQDMDYRS